VNIAEDLWSPRDKSRRTNSDHNDIVWKSSSRMVGTRRHDKFACKNDHTATSFHIRGDSLGSDRCMMFEGARPDQLEQSYRKGNV
jgi:hypothetical protein